MSFGHKVVHANDQDEIWLQTKTNNTLNPQSSDPATAKAVVEYVEKKSAAVDEFVNDKITPLATKTYVTQAIMASGDAIHVYGAGEALRQVGVGLVMSRTVIIVVGDMVQVGFFMKGVFRGTWHAGTTIAKLATKMPMPYANLPIGDTNNNIAIDLAARGFKVQNAFTLWENQKRCCTISYVGDPSTGTVPD
jgi:hypothetical protein